ncbi:MAG TPA: outer membrane beta-barrel protein [Verrucomicrobiota bacterium]|nr:MAG: hypothetical protein BWX84_02762 [Verrucomicrobia bacterium ADurb.Bin118]HPY29769.1 outer membrane beta-barrel protein [Verrucomicrobiota bacterium]HQB15548.1 outer membrane beta-barrel protein [Verrucomicrobiota bacterium]
MKFNQWTIGLAAVGVISLASAARAEESAVPLMTALSSTTISGYVDVSAHWNLGSKSYHGLPYYKFNGPNKSDGFNLNVVQLSIAKPLDESEWAAGYKVDLWMGPDAKILRTTSDWWDWDGDGGYYSGSDFAIRQAYVALRAPVGNGIDFKIGAFDTIIGYESLESGNNPNYTRSYGHSIEPQTHTGVLATYRFSDYVSAAVGVANTFGPWINERAFPAKSESYKTYMGSIALSAPEDWGFLAGSTLYGGVVNGFSSDAWENVTSWYAGATLATPVEGLKFGAAFDYMDPHHGDYDAWAVALYASYQATDKLSFHVRGEHLRWEEDWDDDEKVWALTGTVQYDLWQNVISRVEVRWDHDRDRGFGKYGSKKDAVLLAGNVIYKF